MNFIPFSHPLFLPPSPLLLLVAHIHIPVRAPQKKSTTIVWIIFIYSNQQEILGGDITIYEELCFLPSFFFSFASLTQLTLSVLVSATLGSSFLFFFRISLFACWVPPDWLYIDLRARHIPWHQTMIDCPVSKQTLIFPELILYSLLFNLEFPNWQLLVTNLSLLELHFLCLAQTI